MRKNLKLSLITGTLLASVSLFIGCGGGGGGSASTSGTDSVDTSTAKTTGPVVDGYLVKLRTPVYDDANHTSTDIVLDENNITTGKIRFNTPIKGNVIIPKDAIYDSNGNGKYDPGVDKSLGFPLMGEANYPITPASTYEVITHNPLPEDLKKDPIKELENGNPTLYLIEQSIIKAIKLANNNISILNDINISVEEINGTKIPKVKSDNNESLQKVFNIYNNPILLTATKVALKEGGLKPQELIKAAEINGTIAKKIYDVIDKNNLAAKVVNEAKNYGATDINATTLKYKLREIAKAEQNVVNAIPTRLLVSGIRVGNQNVLLNKNEFNVTVDTTDKNLTDFYNISFPGTSVTKGFNDMSNVGVTITIKDTKNPDKNVELKISGVTISPSDDNRSVIVKALKDTTQLEVTQNNIRGLDEIMNSGTPYTRKIKKNLTMTDLSFNVNTILNSLNDSNNKIHDAINKLNEYISKPGTYKVDITVDGVKSTNADNLSSTDLVADYLKYHGTVTVVNSSGASSSSTSEESSSSTSEATGESAGSGAFL